MIDRSALKDKLKAQWETMAEDWISQFQGGVTTHREALLDGWMLDAVGDVSGLRWSTSAVARASSAGCSPSGARR